MKSIGLNANIVIPTLYLISNVIFLKYEEIGLALSRFTLKIKGYKNSYLD
jgi:hypothetical protein